jgi:hypothetical protein
MFSVGIIDNIVSSRTSRTTVCRKKLVPKSENTTVIVKLVHNSQYGFQFQL